MRKFYAALTTVAMLSCMAGAFPQMTAFAESGIYNGFVYEKYEDHVAVTGYTEELSGEIEIPISIVQEGQNSWEVSSDWRVTEIADSAFAGCEAITSVTLGDVRIASKAFSDCKNLEYVYYDWFKPKQTAEDAFEGCSENLKFAWKTGGVACIYDEDSRTLDVFGSGGTDSFSGNIWRLGRFGWDEEGNCLIQNLVIEDGVTGIGYIAFEGFANLTNVTIPESVTEISGGAFTGTPWLAAQQEINPLVIVNHNVIDMEKCSGDVVIPDGVTRICGVGSKYDSQLTSVTIPASVKIIEEGSLATGRAFAWNETLTIRGYTNTAAERFAETYHYQFEPIGEYLPMTGDCNDDGVLNVKDAVLLKKFLMHQYKEEACIARAADINQDNIVNIYDLIALKRLLLNS